MLLFIRDSFVGVSAECGVFVVLVVLTGVLIVFVTHSDVLNVFEYVVWLVMFVIGKHTGTHMYVLIVVVELSDVL
jgi:hypothetical protein